MRHSLIVRRDIEEGVKVEVIQLNQADLEGFVVWKSSMEKDGYDIFPHAYIEECPTENRVGKIRFSVEAGFFYQESTFRRRGDMPAPVKWVPRGEYSAAATFNYKSVPPWKISELWNSQKFPYLYSNWADYANKTLGHALEEAKKQLTEKFVTIVLPFGITIEKDYSLVIFPSLVLILFIVLVIEVRHVAAYALFCQEEWGSRPIFLSPWIGGRDWWLKWPLLILTLIILPVLSTWLLFNKLPIFGYWRSMILAACFIIPYIILACFILKSLSAIARFSFPFRGLKGNCGENT